MRLLFFFFPLLFATLVQAQEKWTLETCMEHLSANNIDIAIQDINVELAELGVKRSKQDFGPNINAGFNDNHAFGRSFDNTTNQISTLTINSNIYSLDYSQSLFNGLQRINTLKKSKLEVESAALNRGITEQNVQLQLLNIYLSILMAKEQLAQAINQKENTQQEIDRTNALINDGILAANSVFILEAQLSSNLSSITTFENNINTGLADLKLLLRLDLAKDIDIEEPSIPEVLNNEIALEPLTEVYKAALNNRAEIKSAKLNEDLNEYDVKIAKGRFYPTLLFAPAINTNFSDLLKNPFTNESIRYGLQLKDNLNYRLSFSLNIPIYNRGVARLGLQQAKIRASQSLLTTDKAKLDLYQLVSRAHNNAKAAISNYEAAAANEKASKRSLESAQQKLDEGLGTNVEFNVASNNYSIAASRLIEAKYNYIFNIKYLDFYMGVPIEF